MKIGIITYNRIYNFGSVLQTYALNKYLNNQGVNAETINYVQEYQEEKNQSLYFPNGSIMNFFRNVQIHHYHKQLERSRNGFHEFRNNYIQESPKQYDKQHMDELNDKYDLFICGSDQIWNQRYAGFDVNYLLSFVKDKQRCISYAASIGNSQLTEEESKTIESHLKDFKYISVREDSAANLIEPLIHRRPDVVVDPVFLLTEGQWNEITTSSRINKPYALCYFIGDIPGMRQFAREMQRNVKMDLVVIRMNLRDWIGRYIRLYETTPSEFVDLIRSANIVFTNSYHATAFSIIFKKKFWVYSYQQKGFSSQTRIEYLLELCGLPERMINSSSSNIQWNKEVDFTKGMNYLHSHIEYSKQQLMRGILDH